MLRASQTFAVNGKNYPAGSFVVQTAQAFRPHVMDMSSRKTIPTIFCIPVPPVPPYDSARWTSPYRWAFNLIAYSMASPDLSQK